ncbi:hypothetical protein CC79DRAFT_1369815 [Sarocladium strictum]
MDGTQAAARSPDSDVSPASPGTLKPEYFPTGESVSLKTSDSKTTQSSDTPSEPKSAVSFGELRKPADGVDSRSVDNSIRRKSSVSSVTFRRPRNPSLPQGDHQVTGGSRLRASSPPHQR